MITLGIVAILAIMLSAVYSGMETGIYALQRVRLQVQAASGDEVASRLLAVVQRPEVAIATILVLNNCVNYAVAWSTEGLLSGWAGPGTSDVEVSMLATLYVTPVLFIFGELVPKTVFLHRPSVLVARVYPVFKVGSWIVRPLTLPMLAVLRALNRTGAEPAHLLGRPGVTNLLTGSDEGAALTPFQRDVAKGVFALRRLTARSRMIPWSEVATIREDADRQAVIQEAKRAGRKRLMLLDAEGLATNRYVHALEVALAPESDVALPGFAHDAPVVAPDAPLFQVLRTLQRERRPLALVRDREDAPPMGLITATEISEEILGLSAPLRRTRRETLRRTARGAQRSRD